jgi:uncharacterized protein (TIGR03437 family)
MKSKAVAVNIYVSILIQLALCSVASAQSSAEILTRRGDSAVGIIEQWTEIAYPGTPEPNPVFRFFANTGYLFVAPQSGGLFRSGDEGASWQPSQNGIPGATIVRSFAAIGSVIFIGTDRGIFRSADQGQNWTAAGAQLPAANTLIAAVGATLFAASSGSVFRSTDQGQNFAEFEAGLPAGFGGVNSFAVGGSNLYALSGDRTYHLRETGAAWTSTNFGGAFAIAAAGSAVYALKRLVPGNGAANDGVWRSLDEGQNWTQVFVAPPGIFLSDRVTNLEVNGSTLFVSVIVVGSPSATIPTMYYSPDQGRHWFRVYPPIVVFPFSSTLINHIFSFGDRVLIVRSDNRLFISPGFYSPGLANLSAASYSPAGVTPEGIVAAFGVNLSDLTQSAASLPLPFTLGNTMVGVRDSAGIERPAPLFFVSPNQINYQVPPGTTNGRASVIVYHNGAVVGREDLEIVPISPGVFTANMRGDGLAAAVVLRVRADGSSSYEPVARFDAQEYKFVPVPIDLGGAADRVYLILFGTGLRNGRGPHEITAGYNELNWPVLYAGVQGMFVGLDQINLLIPRSLAGSGEVNIQIRAGSVFSNIVTVAIK